MNDATATTAAEDSAPVAPVDVNALVAQWWPLAGGLARKWGDRFPWLSDCFHSAAGEALWKLARSRGHLAPPHFAGLVRKGMRWAFLNVLRDERSQNLAAFQRGALAVANHDDDTPDAIDTIADPHDDTAGTDAAECVAVLLDRAKLTAHQRADVVRVILTGQEHEEAAAARGVTRSSVGHNIAVALVKLRAAAG